MLSTREEKNSKELKMLGNQSNCGVGNKPMFRNARLFPHQNNNCNKLKSEQNSDYIDEDFSNDVPEMKILPMDYVAKAKAKPKCPPPPPPKNFQSKCKCTPTSASSSATPAVISNKPAQKVTINAPPDKAERGVKSKNSDKYLVYKRKHSIFGTSKDSAGEKLKYVSDNDKKSSLDGVMQAKEKKKYLIFDSKKNISKLETIQYYFDNKSYEKYVDNKLYENKLNQQQKQKKEQKEAIEEEKEEVDEAESDCDTNKDFEKVSRSWEYRDNAKTESKLKLFESKHDSQKNKHTNSLNSTKSEDSGASSCSEVSLKHQNCRLNPQQKFTTSKSIGDLTSKTSHDVKRINQIFENAKQHQAAVIANAIALRSNNLEKEKYKIHKKVKDFESGKKYQRSSTELEIKKNSKVTTISSLSSCSSSSSSSSSSPCGFKNCKLSNCPISHTSPAPPPPLPPSNNNIQNNNNNNSNNVLSINERRSKFDENFIRKFEDMRKNSPNVILKNNEITVNNKTNISVNGKSNIIVNDMKSNNNFTPPSSDGVFIVNEKELKTNNSHNHRNDNNKTTIKINDSCFVVNHSSSNGNDIKINNNERNKNIIELNSERALASNWDKNIRVKNNPQPKFNNKIDVNNKIKSEENSVKIYVLGSDTAASSPTPSTSLTSSSHDSSDSDKDDGYYDASSQGRSSSPEFSEMFKKLRDLCSMKAKNSQIGCDSTLFWNNSYFDEDEADIMLTALNKKTDLKTANSASRTYACTKCHTTTEDLMSNYICICRNSNKVKLLLKHFFISVKEENDALTVNKCEC